MATVDMKIRWHDMTEDPSDMPIGDRRCMVTVMATETALFFCATFRAWYNCDEEQTWTIVDRDFSLSSERVGVDTAPFKVVAWAYAPKTFIPNSILAKYKLPEENW